MPGSVDIANQALLAIGAQAQIAALNEGSTEADACNAIYNTRLEALLRSAHWDFARTQIPLTQLKAFQINGVLSSNPPPTPWQYEYAYPSDCLQVRYIFVTPPLPSQAPVTAGISSFPKPGPQRFQIAMDKDANGNSIKVILTNAPMAQAVYTALVDDVDLWDSNFTDAMIANLAAWLVNPLNRNRALMNDMFKLAEAVIQQARITDGNEGFTQQDHIADWLQVRGRGGGWADDALFWGGWQSISFPGGFVI